MGVLAYEDDPVTSPLCGETSLPLGTIVEAQEGSTGDESETETLPDPSLPPPPISITCYSNLKKDQSMEVSLDGGGDEKEDDDGDGDGIMEEIEVNWKEHPDVDGGWAWVVLFSCFFIFIITAGMLSTNGMYYVQMLEEYGHSRSYTAWLGSLLNAFYMLGGPISAIFIKHYGSRPSLMVGAVLMSVGYFLSAFATSLETLFFTYGVIVGEKSERKHSRFHSACGMNFSYSGQIIALAQYFDRKHSIATSLAMLGIGLGMLLMSPWVEYNIQEYGWRGSFIWNAGISLNVAVFGFLIFPIRGLGKEEQVTHNDEDKVENGQQPHSISIKGIPASRSRYLFEKSLNDRSFSSLRLSLGASYLSHSLLSLSDRRGSQHYEPSLGSNQYSFCSRGSHFAIGSIRSNGTSLCARDGHVEQGHCDLPHHHHHSHYNHYHHITLNTDPGLTSNAHSFSSRRDSQLGLGGIKSNPQSFSRASQMEICYPHQEREVESLKGGAAGGRPRFVLREGDCDLSCCMEEEEDNSINLFSEQRTVCQLMVERVKLFTHSFRKSFKEQSNHPLLDLRFWLLDFAIFFSMVSTLFIFIIYMDFANSKGLGEYFSPALSSLGIGDAIGRLSVGVLLSFKWLDSILLYTIAMFFCGIDILCHIFISSSTQFITLSFLFGVMYGAQNILIAVAPSQVFGRDFLPIVFGHILFLGGIGALFGAPLAGFIVDQTGSYDALMFFSVVCIFFATSLMCACYLVNRNVKLREQVKDKTVTHVKIASHLVCADRKTNCLSRQSITSSAMIYSCGVIA
ncbi:hypothetical protein Pcinc_021318 [Petrolisthes cinctipes]|uniref:Monocarboxylate transporter 9 n=1 Tax=Petrolisthes cinctipes TaxID=88211 RepID=A0AAE1FGJ3_PETCI|nr:hypothetical protein Pcinc_021318 [Petrolisthes cinctipes]